MQLTMEVQGDRGSPWWKVLLIAIGITVTMASVGPSMHAVAKHGLEAVEISDACNKGPFQTWSALGKKNKGAFWQICETGDGKFGIRKIRCTKNGWKAQTAFFPDSASGFEYQSLNRAVEYVSARAKKFFGRLTCP